MTTFNNNNFFTLQHAYGGPLGTYQPSIIRPFDNTHMLNEVYDIKRDTFEKCSGPCYTGSKYQEWCSEKNATKYFAMRPLITSGKYNENLAKMFFMIVNSESGNNDDFRKNSGLIDWTQVFCSTSKKDLMSFIMSKVALATSKMPEMQKNGSWEIEQFFWTDADIYQGFSKQRNLSFYNIIFNLYNPLRSVSTMTEVTIYMSSSGPIITYMNFVNSGDWKSNGMKVDGISSYNDAGQPTDKEIKGNPNPNELDWNYGNTLLKQEFNKYGFYDQSNNVKVTAKVPDSLKNKISYFENNSKSYLLECATGRTNGIQPVQTSNGTSFSPQFKFSDINNSGPVTALNSYLTTYNDPLVLVKNGPNVLNAVNRKPEPLKIIKV